MVCYKLSLEYINPKYIFVSTDTVIIENSTFKKDTFVFLHNTLKYII